MRGWVAMVLHISFYTILSKDLADVMSSLSGSTNEVVSLVSETTATVEEIEHAGKGKVWDIF